MSKTKDSFQANNSPIAALIWLPQQLQAFLEEKSNWQQQVYLGFRKGWVFGLVGIWLLALLLIARYNWPVYNPEMFWSGISLDWTIDKVTNFKILLSYSFWPLIGYLTIGAMLQLFANLLSSDFLFFKTNPFLFWTIAMAGVLTSSLVPGKMLIVLLFIWIVFFGLYKSGKKYELKENPFDYDNKEDYAALFLLFFPCILWLVYGIALLITNYYKLIETEITFVNWIARGVILFFALLFAIIFVVSSTRESNSSTIKRMSIFGTLVLFLFPFFWIFYDVINLPFMFFLKVVLFFFGALLLWLFLNTRIWNWLIISGQLAFSRQSVSSHFLKDQLLPFPPYCSKSRIKQAAIQEPLELLALGTYLEQNKGWKKLNKRILDAIAIASKNENSALIEKINFVQAK